MQILSGKGIKASKVGYFRHESNVRDALIVLVRKRTFYRKNSKNVFLVIVASNFQDMGVSHVTFVTKIAYF